MLPLSPDALDANDAYTEALRGCPEAVAIVVDQMRDLLPVLEHRRRVVPQVRILTRDDVERLTAGLGVQVCLLEFALLEEFHD